MKEEISKEKKTPRIVPYIILFLIIIVIMIMIGNKAKEKKENESRNAEITDEAPAIDEISPEDTIGPKAEETPASE